MINLEVELGLKSVEEIHQSLARDSHNLAPDLHVLVHGVDFLHVSVPPVRRESIQEQLRQA